MGIQLLGIPHQPRLTIQSSNGVRGISVIVELDEREARGFPGHPHAAHATRTEIGVRRRGSACLQSTHCLA